MTDVDRIAQWLELQAENVLQHIAKCADNADPAVARSIEVDAWHARGFVLRLAQRVRERAWEKQ